MKYVIPKQTIADTRKKLIKNEPNAMAVPVLFNLLVDSLALHERKAYQYVLSNPDCTGKQIACSLGIQHNHTGNIMKRLFDYGLVTNVVLTDDSGLYYQWRGVVPDNG